MGITQQCYCKWESSITTPDPSSMAKLSQLFGVSIDAMFSYDPRMVQSPDHLYFLPPGYYKMHPLPVYENVFIQRDTLALSHRVGEKAAFVHRPEDYFYLRILDDTMAPRICAGDYALVHRQNELRNGDIGLFIVEPNSSGILRRYFLYGDTVVLRPFDPRQGSFSINKKDIQSIYILGRLEETSTFW